MSRQEKIILSLLMLGFIRFIYKRYINPSTLIGNAVITANGRSINNPGNIVKSSTVYRGEIEGVNGSNFKSFASMEYGYRAMNKILIAYYNQGYKTIYQAIKRYSGDDNALPYAQYVASHLNAKNIYDDLMPFLSDKDKTALLIKAMAHFEQGGNFVADFNQVKNSLNLV